MVAFRLVPLSPRDRRRLLARQRAVERAQAAYLAELQHLRDQGYTLAEIAEALGVTRQAIHKALRRPRT